MSGPMALLVVFVAYLLIGIAVASVFTFLSTADADDGDAVGVIIAWPLVAIALAVFGIGWLVTRPVNYATQLRQRRAERVRELRNVEAEVDRLLNERAR